MVTLWLPTKGKEWHASAPLTWADRRVTLAAWVRGDEG